MNDQLRLRILGTALVFLLELFHLAWEYFHGGIRSHNILNRADLPAISNAWGALLLPALTWFLSAGMLQRTRPHVAWAFVGSLSYGAALASAFVLDQESITSSLFLGMFIMALILPVFRGEYMLGFILGMTFTFGGVLPTAVSMIVASLSAVFHALRRRIFSRR